MKFGYAIVLALVALVAVSGFAAADRLPQQVPENQIFTIDTLIDVTGAVSQESEMQWTINSQSEATEGIYYNTGHNGNITSDGYAVTPDQYAQLVDWAQAFAATYGGAASDYLAAYRNSTDGNYYISKLYVPEYELEKFPNKNLFGSNDLSDLMSDIMVDNDYYVFDDAKKFHTPIHDSRLFVGEEIAILTWSDTLRSNGGKLALNENIDFDSRNKGKGLNNLEVEKVLTYAGTEGAHLVGAEEWTLDVAGNWEKTADSIRCVFAAASTEYFPAFCNVVKAKSELVNINSAQVSTKGAARAVAATGDIPAMLNYQIAVTPDSNSGSGFADGTVKTLFGGSIMEGRAKNQIPSATNNWKDTASVTGGIKNFQKTFAYESGFTF